MSPYRNHLTEEELNQYRAALLDLAEYGTVFVPPWIASLAEQEYAERVRWTGAQHGLVRLEWGRSGGDAVARA